MDENRLGKLLWIVKAGLLAVLVGVCLEVAVSRLHLSSAFDPGTARGEPQATDTPDTLPPAHARPDYATVSHRNLFATTDRVDVALTPRPPQTPASATPAGDLGLRLVGTIAGGPTASRAIIQDARSNATGSYRIGDTVAAATVKAIQRDTVVLQYQGRPLVVKLCSGKTENGGRRVEAGQQKTPAAGPMTDGQSRSSSLAEASSSPSPQSPRVGYMTEVFRKATIEPYLRNNRAEGVRITGLEDIPMAQLFGFQNGDIVQSVNGQPVTSKQKAFQVLMKAKTQPKIDIQLLRNGQSKNLSFNL